MVKALLLHSSWLIAERCVKLHVVQAAADEEAAGKPLLGKKQDLSDEISKDDDGGETSGLLSKQAGKS